MHIEEGRRQAYLAALGIPLWTARLELPGALPAAGLEFVAFTDEMEGSAPLVDEPQPAAYEVREPVPVVSRVAEVSVSAPAHVPPAALVPVARPAPVSPANPRPAATTAPATAGPGVEFPVFQFWFRNLPQGWQLLVLLGDDPDLTGREHALLAQIEQALGGESQQGPLAFRWPLNNNPAIPRDAQAACESVGAFLGRQRRAGERCLLLGPELQPYVQAALGDSLVVADSLATLLAEPLRKRALWQAFGMSVLLRPMVADDLDEVVPMEVLAHAYPWTPGIFSDGLVSGYNCWVLEEAEKIIAYGIVQIVVGEAHLLNITVDPQHHGRGLGRQLLNELIEISRPKAETMFLEVRPSNKRAVGLYNSVGFNEIGLRKNYYPAPGGAREHALMMALML